MAVSAASTRISAVTPRLVLPGGRVVIEGGAFADDQIRVTIEGEPALVQFASRSRIVVRLPDPCPAGALSLRIDDLPGERVLLSAGQLLATGLHQVDSPAVGPDGVVYLTYSGSRGQQAPVAIYRVRPGGPREIFSTGITNPTSLAFDPSGRLHVSSRFDGTVSRLDADGVPEVIASDLGIACGIAFDADGTLFVGDRSGTVFRIDSEGATSTFATLPPSVAAFHLAVAPDGLYVTGPTLAPRDRVYRVTAGSAPESVADGFGRPQGLAVDRVGRVHVAEALAGESGLFRITGRQRPELVVSGVGLVGAAFDDAGNLYVVSSESCWKFPADLIP
jgi:sugar lactone lactonase YvrE